MAPSGPINQTGSGTREKILHDEIMEAFTNSPAHPNGLSVCTRTKCYLRLFKAIKIILVGFNPFSLIEGHRIDAWFRVVTQTRRGKHPENLVYKSLYSM